MNKAVNFDVNHRQTYQSFVHVTVDTDCTESEFKCNNTQCIPTSWRCDGDTDCKDESDEIDCPTQLVPAR